MECKYVGDMLIDENMEWYCPNCGNTDKTTMNVAALTFGYIGVNYFNYGRTSEISEREYHLDNIEFKGCE